MPKKSKSFWIKVTTRSGSKTPADNGIFQGKWDQFKRLSQGKPGIAPKGFFSLEDAKAHMLEHSGYEKAVLVNLSKSTTSGVAIALKAPGASGSSGGDFDFATATEATFLAWLIAAKPSTDKTAPGYASLSHFAAANNYGTAVFGQLLTLGHNLSQAGVKKATPLHDACKTGQTRAIKALLKRSADQTARAFFDEREHGKTPLRCLKEKLDATADSATRARLIDCMNGFTTVKHRNVTLQLQRQSDGSVKITGLDLHRDSVPLAVMQALYLVQPEQFESPLLIGIEPSRTSSFRLKTGMHFRHVISHNLIANAFRKSTVGKTLTEAYETARQADTSPKDPFELCERIFQDSCIEADRPTNFFVGDHQLNAAKGKMAAALALYTREGNPSKTVTLDAATRAILESCGLTTGLSGDKLTISATNRTAFDALDDFAHLDLPTTDSARMAQAEGIVTRGKFSACLNADGRLNPRAIAEYSTPFSGTDLAERRPKKRPRTGPDDESGASASAT